VPEQNDADSDDEKQKPTGNLQVSQSHSEQVQNRDATEHEQDQKQEGYESRQSESFSPLGTRFVVSGCHEKWQVAQRVENQQQPNYCLDQPAPVHTELTSHRFVREGCLLWQNFGSASQLGKGWG
jgi:hypothetical protein